MGNYIPYQTMDVIAYPCLLLTDLFGETARGHLSIDVSNLIPTGRHKNICLSTEAPRTYQEEI